SGKEVRNQTSPARDNCNPGGGRTGRGGTRGIRARVSCQRRSPSGIVAGESRQSAGDCRADSGNPRRGRRLSLVDAITTCALASALILDKLPGEPILCARLICSSVFRQETGAEHEKCVRSFAPERT